MNLDRFEERSERQECETEYQPSRLYTLPKESCNALMEVRIFKTSSMVSIESKFISFYSFHTYISVMNVMKCKEHELSVTSVRQFNVSQSVGTVEKSASMKRIQHTALKQ